MVNVCHGVCQELLCQDLPKLPTAMALGWVGRAQILEPNLDREPGGCFLGLKGESLKGESWQESLMGKCDTKSGKPKIVAGLFITPPWNCKKEQKNTSFLLVLFYLHSSKCGFKMTVSSLLSSYNDLSASALEKCSLTY